MPNERYPQLCRPETLRIAAQPSVLPILHLCGSLDPWLDRDTRVAEKKYKELGGNLTVIIRQGEGHFATGPLDPKPVVDFFVAKTN